MTEISSRRALAELLFAACLWGFGFIGIRWGLLSLGPLTLNATRFGLSFLVGIVFCFSLPSLRHGLRWSDAKLGCFPGLLLGMTLVLQTYGLQYTTITKSGFITCLYVVFVPLISYFFLGQKVNRTHSLWVGVSLVGAALICQLDSFVLNIGDVFTLACAVTAALQILEVSRLSARTQSALGFTLSQVFWATLIPLGGALFFEPLPTFPLPLKSVVGVSILAFGVTLLAFCIQVRAQRVLSASLVSLIFLIESPFAAVFAYFLEGERLTISQTGGAFLILFASAGSIYFQGRKPNAKST